MTSTPRSWFITQAETGVSADTDRRQPAARLQRPGLLRVGRVAAPRFLPSAVVEPRLVADPHGNRRLDAALVPLARSAAAEERAAVADAREMHSIAADHQLPLVVVQRITHLQQAHVAAHFLPDQKIMDAGACSLKRIDDRVLRVSGPVNAVGACGKLGGASHGPVANSP